MGRGANKKPLHAYLMFLMQTTLADEHEAPTREEALALHEKVEAQSQSEQGEPSKDYVGFKRRAQEIGKLVLELKNPLIVHHFDCDGLSSGALVSLALDRAGVTHGLKMLKRLDEEKLAEALAVASEQQTKNLVFTDLGSGFANVLVEQLSDFDDVVILDHHPPQKRWDELPSSFHQLNVHDFGIEGAVEACGASTAYYAFKHFTKNADIGKPFEQIGTVGAVGDIQDQGGLITLNREMVEDGVQNGTIEVSKNLRAFGRVSRPIVWFLTYLTEPFIPGLSGDEKACATFLDGLGLPLRNGENWVHYNDLTLEQQQALSSALIEFAEDAGVEEDTLQALFGEIYSFPRENPHEEVSDAYEFSTLLNACGRHDAPLAGIAVLKNEPDSLKAARELLFAHRKEIQAGILFARKNYADLGAFYLLDARGVVRDSVIGTVAGSFLGSGLVPRTKPVLAFSLDEEKPEIIKISGRGTKELVEAGLHLGRLMGEAAAPLSGIGGGHNNAAGATIPEGRELEFLKKAKEILKNQIGV